MFKLFASKGATNTVAPPSFPTLEQIHDDLAIAGDDDVIFTTRAVGLDIGIAHLGPGDARSYTASNESATSGVPQASDGKLMKPSRSGRAGDCETDSSLHPVYDRVKMFVEEAERMKNSIADLADESERLEGLMTELAASVKAVQHQTSSKPMND